MPLSVGQQAPAFTLDTDAGTPLSLSSLRGKRVVLYFYPKDDTSGCTLESCEFRDLFPRFGASDAVILGASPDDVKSHQKFKAKYQLPFTLLADPSHAMLEAYDVWKEKSMYGNKYMGVERTTYIIGADGVITHVFEKVKPEGHAAEVMAALTGGRVAAAPAKKAPATKAGRKSAAKKAPAKKAVKKSAAKRPVKKAAKKAVKKVAKKSVKRAPARKAAKKK